MAAPSTIVALTIHGGTNGEMLTPPHDGDIFQGAPNETAVITTADATRVVRQPA